MKLITDILGIEVPVICGPMYPCSNPELIAGVSEAGGIGIIQPLSFVYVYGQDYRKSLRWIRSQTKKPFGMNALIEKNSKTYEDRMKKWVDISIEEGCRFFVTSLGNPKWVVQKAEQVGAKVFHDVTEKKWAAKALDSGVHGLICVNNRAGGHLGDKSPQVLYDELKGFGVPLVCAGGVGNERQFVEMLKIGYAGVLMGTRFIATQECKAHQDYKDAILRSSESDIVMTDRVTGLPLSVINTPYLEKIGAQLGPVVRFLLQQPKTKHWTRTFLNLKSVLRFKTTNLKGMTTKDFYQAGKSVETIKEIESVREIMSRFHEELEKSGLVR